MKIEIRRRPADEKPANITIREKTIYVCKRCSNHYYSYHFFCPQCMGEIFNSAPQFSILRIMSISTGNPKESESLLERLSGMEGFDFEASLKKLPWICMKQSDPTILRVWKECLESAGLRCDIIATIPPAKGRKRKENPPLFPQNATYPFFLPRSLIDDMRSAARSLPSATLRLSWAETSTLALNLLERIYKKQSDRVLFIDYVYQIEESIREFISQFLGEKISLESFERRNKMLLKSFRRMESEMDSVREQVRNQL
jgi:hypothetical protein